MVTGDLGFSFDWQKPIKELIGERIALTVMLGLFTFAFTWLLAIPIGIISAVKQYSWLDYFFTVFNYFGVATPTFMTALILMWIAFSQFGVSVTGLFSPEYVDAPWTVDRVQDLLRHIWLPMIILGLDPSLSCTGWGVIRAEGSRIAHVANGQVPTDPKAPVADWLPMIILGLDGTARLARIMRANLLDELNKPYVEMARAKGMSEWKLVMKYPVRLAINPLVSTIGWYLPLIFSGSVIVATVLNLPTIGPMLLRALIGQDMFLAGTIIMIYLFLAIIGTLISDILLAWLDPRIRME